MQRFPFIVRVYGIYIDEQRNLLISDEFVQDKFITKFPGGGLQFGEGTIDCLKREMVEETAQEFDVLDHFYTTDFFVPSAFDPDAQVVCIYYEMRPVSPLRLSFGSKPFDFVELKPDAQSFRWISLEDLSPADFTLPIDQRVAELILESWRSVNQRANIES